jgi:tetratricopeptide (TPR) repeat protein
MDDEKYEILKKEVDSIQIQMAQERGPWYTKPSTIIATFALLFSFGTTVVSFYNAHLEDIRDNRREARALIQRMTKLPIENYELLLKHEGSGPGEALSGMINQENILLATQASELLERYPDSFSSTEYFAVAVALCSSNIVEKAPYLFKQAIHTASSSNDYNTSARAYAALLYAKGDLTEGKKYYELALSVWDRFPERNLYVVNSVDLVTLIYWSQAESGVNNIAEARKKLNQAKEKLSQLAPCPMTKSLANQIDSTESAIEQAHAAEPR